MFKFQMTKHLLNQKPVDNNHSHCVISYTVYCKSMIYNCFYKAVGCGVFNSNKCSPWHLE